MKSVFLTIIFFIILFSSLKMGILDIIDTTAFSYITFISFFAVIIVAIYFIGLPKLPPISEIWKMIKEKDDDNEKK